MPPAHDHRPTPVPTPSPTEPPPTWVRIVARATAFTALPSGLWRIALAVGLPVGYSRAEARTLFDVPGSGTAVLVGLSLLLEGLALLTLGLVAPWGERLPTWLPVVGGRRPDPTAIWRAALTGAVALTLIWVPFAVLWWVTPGDGALDATARALIGVAYLPLAAWGPLLAVTALDHRRRHGPRRRDGDRDR